MATYGSFRKVLSILMTLTAISSLAKENPRVNFDQVDEGPRSIGSNVTIVSNVTIITTCSLFVITFFVKYPTTKHFNFTYVGSLVVNNKECGKTQAHFRQSKVPHLNISNVVNHGNRTKQVMWHFSNLPESYDGLQLIYRISSTVRTTDNITLTVLGCKPSVRVVAFRQNESYTITATKRIGNSRSVRFQDLGTCNCTEEGQLLFHSNGTRADGVARCAYNAVWSGCVNLQCWSAPRNLTITQLNRTEGSQRPFDCTFTDGFPAAHEIRYKIDNVTLPPNYKLRSSDNGKFVSCDVVSNFSLATDEKASSPLQDIIVYYPPERSFLSTEFASVHLNSTNLLHFVFFANPLDGRFRLNFENDRGNGNDALQSQLLLWKEYYSQNTIHIYTFKIQVTSETDYGNYSICVSSYVPVGRSCSQLTVSNPLRVLYFETPSFLMIACFVSAGVLLCFLCCVVLYLVLRRRNNIHSNLEAAKKREFFKSGNELYAEYEVKRCNADFKETNLGPQIYENTEPHACYEEVH